ncbi:YbaN family protein [Acinetobacter sp. WZC-1]|uniref:YbaN family protein n=1 Tax=Acinetobacter sp. WZC-1 TaxID=3459034 RepID=UPI00403D6521
MDKARPENQSQSDELVAEIEHQLSKSMLIRGLCIVMAWLCIGLGILGIFIPGLPTVDFMILAVFFAARGSIRLHTWLMNNRYIGPLIREWKQHRRIPKKVKYLSTVSMSVATLIMIFTIPHPWFVYPAIICMAGVLWWMWRIETA